MNSSRQTKLSIDLGGEQVELERIEARESLSTPFNILIDVIAPLGELDILPHLGKGVHVSVSQDDELQRHFHGIAVEGEFLRESPEGFHHRILLQPWTYFLSHNRNFAIFQERTALAIIQEVLHEAYINDVDYTSLFGTFPEREYCVQYGESDFAFISRLMEEEGIYYFFHHQEDRHVMVLCNSPSSHHDGRPAKLTYSPESASVFNTDSAARTDSGRKFYAQSWAEKVSSGGELMLTTRDFDFKKPEQPLNAEVQGATDHPLDRQEVYQYPGRFIEEDHGKKLGDVALQALRAQRKRYTGTSRAAGLSCGFKFTLADHPLDRVNTSYLITDTFHSVTAERYRSGASGSDQEPDSLVFGAVPASVLWRAPQLTPRPIVPGLESAVVSGPSGEEIFTDEYGRVKVRFHWDRARNEGEKSTCWIRVSQTGGLGNIIMPRVGHEVLVDFLAGDPDRPVVVGRVFNKSHMPVYALPDNKTVALWRTKRYGHPGDYAPAQALDTGAPGANELRFDDKGGHEEVFLHAERDMKSRVRHNESHHVGGDQEIKVRHDRTELVENDEQVKIGRDQSREVVRDRTTKIGGNDDVEIEGKLRIKVGTTIEIEAGTSITLKVGSTEVKLDLESIKQDSAMIETSGTATVDVKSPMTTVKGDGMLTLKGGLTMIN